MFMYALYMTTDGKKEKDYIETAGQEGMVLVGGGGGGGWLRHLVGATSWGGWRSQPHTFYQH